VVKFAAGELGGASYYRIFTSNAKGDEKKEFENKHSDKAFRCEQEKKTADLSRAHTCRM
jgi:hypothetical protein